MIRKKLVSLGIGLLVVGLASMAWANIPDMTMSYATSNSGAQVSCLVCPQGDGTPLTACYVYGGGPVGNATLNLYLLDANGDPVFPYPCEDMWFEFVDGSVTLCPGDYVCGTGSISDQDTDATGHTMWVQALPAGGCGEKVKIYVSGMALAQAPLAIYKFNSPDENADLVVNLTDVVLFAGDYYGPYDYCSDFYWDGILNLSDIVVLAQHMGHACP
jgi:hypothetical protein